MQIDADSHRIDAVDPTQKMKITLNTSILTSFSSRKLEPGSSLLSPNQSLAQLIRGRQDRDQR